MGKVRVVFKNDNTVAVIHPVLKSGLSEEQVFNKAMQGELKGLPYKDMDSSELPQSREDRDAWEGDEKKRVKVNQAKAQKIKKEKEKVDLVNKKMKEIAEKELKAEEKIKE